MEILFNEYKNIAIALSVVIAGIVIAVLLLFILLKKYKLNVFCLQSNVDKIMLEIKELEDRKRVLDETIYNAIKDEEKVRLSIEGKKSCLTSLKSEIRDKESEFKRKKSAHENKIAELTKTVEYLDAKTKHLQSLESNAKEIDKKIQMWNKIKYDLEEDSKKLHEIQSKIDLYSQIDEFTERGLFDKPEYIYETEERYAIEIENIRNKQKEFIKNGRVVIGPNKEYDIRLSFIGKVLGSQKDLIIKTFNIECDFLIGKVNPSNFQRTLKRIQSIADSLEKRMADLRYGINNEYVYLKMQECKLQYESELLKKQQREEQRAIREQIREEQKAKREYERELLAAEKDERKYVDMLEHAKQAIKSASGEALQKAELRIKQLEEQLAAAIARAERAKSMAEQTRYGHVYVISNIGSFGDGVYKIGLTRRLDPMERVRELGDASVPFSFDVHAMIASDDAPALEHALHCAFDDRRVNAVNTRKEFFKVPIEEIQKKVNEITNGKALFVMTKRAEEYYQTKRLKEH